LEVGGVLGRNNHLVAVTAFLHPFSNPALGFLELVIVGRVDEVTSILVEEIQDLLCLFLIAMPHVILPIDEVSETAREQLFWVSLTMRRQSSWHRDTGG
jgi:hypothetical protein